MPFVRNEVSKIFEVPFYDDVIYRNDSKLFTRTNLKLKRTYESLPTALRLRNL